MLLLAFNRPLSGKSELLRSNDAVGAVTSSNVRREKDGQVPRELIIDAGALVAHAYAKEVQLNGQWLRGDWQGPLARHHHLPHVLRQLPVPVISLSPFV